MSNPSHEQDDAASQRAIEQIAHIMQAEDNELGGLIEKQDEMGGRAAWSDEQCSCLAEILRCPYITYREAAVLLNQRLGTHRTEKQVRQKWLLCLRPGIIRGRFSAQETALIARLFRETGGNVRAIARRLPGREIQQVRRFLRGKKAAQLLE